VIIVSDFEFGDIVYLKTDTEQNPRMVIGIDHRPGFTTIMLASGTSTTSHYPIELSKEKDYSMSGNVDSKE
jgi:hypothetical protein